MIPYIGDFAEDATIVHYFNTFDSNDPANSVTITNLADTDIYVYKDGSVTDIVTDGASVVIDFDARTGVHKLTIDTSVHADYAIGSDYMVLIEGTTVDAGTVTAAIFTFSIENRYNAAADDLANGTDGLGALKTLIDAIQTDLDNGTDGLGAIKTDTAAILVDTSTTLDDHLTDIKGTGFVKDTHSLIDIETYVDILDDGTSGNAKIATDVAAVLVDTADIQPNYATSAELAKVPKSDGTSSWNATALAAINAEVDTALDTAISELGVGVPSATPGLKDAVMLLYMALRNQTIVQTSGTDALEIHNNAGTKIASKALTDDGSDYTEAKMISG